MWHKPVGSYTAPWGADRVLVVTMAGQGYDEDSRLPRRVLEDGFFNWAETGGWRLSGMRSSGLGENRTSIFLNELVFHRERR